MQIYFEIVFLIYLLFLLVNHILIIITCILHFLSLDSVLENDSETISSYDLIRYIPLLVVLTMFICMLILQDIHVFYHKILNG